MTAPDRAIQPDETPLISRAEWQRVTVFTVIVVVMIGLPYLIGALASTPDQIFTGFLVGRIGVEDGSSYLAKMVQGAHGEALGHLPHTGQPHIGTLFFIFYRVLGAVCHLLGLPFIIGFHLARLAFSAAFIFLLYRFIAAFVRPPATRFIAVVLITVSGGIGWLAILNGLSNPSVNPPLEMVSPESFTFWMLYTTPHLILAQILMLLGVFDIWRAGTHGEPKRVVRASVLWLGMAVLQPVFVAVVLALTVFMVIGRSIGTRRIKWRQAGAGLLASAVAALMVIYSAVVFAIDPVYAYWASTQLTTASGLGQFLINYAILVIFAVVGLHEAIHHRADPGLTFLGAWLLLQPLMLYAPTNAQQRLILGWQIPLSIFAAYGITRCALPAIARILRVRDWPPNRIRWLQRWIVIGVVLFTDVTYGLLLAWQVVSVTSHQTEYFNSASLLTVVDWLDQHATYADGVLASYSTSTVIPAHAGVRVHAGHHNETAWVDDRMAEIMKFFQRDTPDAWRRDLLMRFSLTYVLVGPEERALGAFKPYTAPYLKLVFESGDVRLYQVKL